MAKRPGGLGRICRLAGVIALFVTLDVRPTFREKLLAAITAQAAASLEREPGCVQFDVCVDTADPNRVLLYEVYEDEAAFEAHGTTPHFTVWRAAADECVEHLERTIASIVPPGQQSADGPTKTRSLIVFGPGGRDSTESPSRGRSHGPPR